MRKMMENNTNIQNMDESSLASVLKKKEIITCGEVKIGIFHGNGAPKSLLRKVKEKLELV